MPKNPLKFTRRKSSPLILDDASTTPTVSSFRVLERPEKINFDADHTSVPAGRPVTRPFSSPLAQLRAASTDRLDVSPSGSVLTPDAATQDWTLKGGRASGGTVRSGSSFYESSAASVRHSSTSTLPSSVDVEKELDDEELFPRKARTGPAFHDVPLNDHEPPRQPTSFTQRAAQALSLAQAHGRTQSTPGIVSNLPARPKTAARSPERHSSPRRERAMTTSSHASTAKPDVHLEITSPDTNNIYGSPVGSPQTGDDWDGPLPPLPPVPAYHRTDSPPILHSRNHSLSPARRSPEVSRDEIDSPYEWDPAWDRRGSADGLMAGSPSQSPDLGVPPPPPHRTSALFGQSNDGYAKVPDRYSSPRLDSNQDGFFPDRTSYGAREYLGKENRRETGDRLVHTPNLPKPTDASNRTSTFEYATMQTRSDRPSAATGRDEEGDESLFSSSSRNATPRAARSTIAQQQNDKSFDSSPLGPPSRAIRPSPNSNVTPKRMTKEQFERLQRSKDPAGDFGEEEQSRSDGEDYDEEDDKARAQQLAKQRQKQEANMSVYRQQMKKVIGGGPTEASPTVRPGVDRSPASTPALGSSSGSIHFGGIEGTPPPEASLGKQSDDDEDDDVPLGILQAHGFPRSGRPVSSAGENDLAAQRRSSPAGAPETKGSSTGNLPVFARKLPADPYFGAGIVSSANREAIGFTGSPSVYGGLGPSMSRQSLTPSMGQPGGLVGVIAGEERARASRRGSPNPATGNYGSDLINMSSMAGHPGMAPRAVSVGSVLPPNVRIPSGMGQAQMMGMPQIPMVSDPVQQEQLQQFMQMQMQFMQNMMAMQQQQQQPQMGQGPTPAPAQQTPDYLGVPLGHGKRQSSSTTDSAARSGPRSIRASTMLEPPTAWSAAANGQRQNSYASSALNAPSSGGTPGYTPSIAPSERSNVGMPSRYRPVHVSSDGSLRSTSIAAAAGAADDSQRTPTAKATVRAIDKPKGTPRLAVKTPSITSEEEESEGWADMKKKREEKKKGFRMGKKGREITLDELVHELR